MRAIEQIRNYSEIKKLYLTSLDYADTLSQQIGTPVILESVVFDNGNIIITIYYEMNGVTTVQLYNSYYQLIAFTDVSVHENRSCMEIRRFDIVEEMQQYKDNLKLMVGSIKLLATEKGVKEVEGAVNEKYSGLFREKKFTVQQPENEVVFVYMELSKLKSAIFKLFKPVGNWSYSTLNKLRGQKKELTALLSRYEQKK